jgi:hypothetical protein
VSLLRAVCVRCAADRVGYDRICPTCGFRPEGDGLLVAWLLSAHNLDEPGLDRVARRIIAGESIRPSGTMIAKARRALGQALSSDPGLSTQHKVALLGTSVVLTPAVGLVLALWWRGERPRAALQCLALSLPFSLIYALLVAMTVYA